LHDIAVRLAKTQEGIIEIRKVVIEPEIALIEGDRVRWLIEKVISDTR